MTVTLVAVCASGPSFAVDPNDPKNVEIANGVRRQLNKSTGELTKMDLVKAKMLWFDGNQPTDISALARLSRLERLGAERTPDINGAGITETQKALPNCRILNNTKIYASPL